MTLNQKYRAHRKISLTKYIKLFCLIVIICMFSFTFSAYNSTVKMNPNFDVAKWKILINGEDISSQVTNLSSNIKLIPTTEGTEDNIIKAGQKGYFDVVINPAETEVAINYSVELDFSKMPSAIRILSYSTIENSIETNKGNLPENNTFTGTMSLNEGQPLTASNSITYRIYWQWDGEDYEIDYDSYEIDVTVTVEQKIG